MKTFNFPTSNQFFAAKYACMPGTLSLINLVPPKTEISDIAKGSKFENDKKIWWYGVKKK